MDRLILVKMRIDEVLTRSPCLGTYPSGSFGRLRVIAMFIAIGTPLGACSTSLQGFRDEGARPVTAAHYRAQRMRIEGGWGPPYYLAPQDKFQDTRPYAMVDIGYANPLLSWRRFPPNWSDPAEREKPFGWYNRTTRQPMQEVLRNDPGVRPDSARMWAGQISLPVAFHLFWDPISDNAPIVDTDYEFGGEIAVRAALTYKDEIRSSIYAGHISTHIGDEYTIAARSDPRQLPFPRINVSYEPLRVALGYRHYGPTGDNRYASFPLWRLDVVGNLESSCLPGLCGSNPYYNVEPTESDGYPVPLTKEHIEGSLSVEGSVTRGFCDNQYSTTRIPGDVHFAILLGVQNVFPYRPDAGLPVKPVVDGEYAPVLNAVLGWGFRRPNIGTLPATAYIRYYRGPNPYGQLRNQRDFSLVSVGLTLSR